MTVHGAFRKVAHATACAIGSPYAFAAAVMVVVVWAVCGPAFHYSDTWQLVINTGTTIVTFLVVFMIQNTQNRDSRAIHLKLDELIRAVESARNRLVDVEDLPDEELARLAREFQRLRRLADAHEATTAPPARARPGATATPPRSSDKP
ncbi:MAG TPA: low affinity iron permease family protein [Kofleriaceae bacterium]